MKLRAVVISAACLTFFVAPASSTSLLAAAAAIKGAILEAGLTALKPSGGSETLIIQSEPGSNAEVVQSNQIIVQDLGYKPMQTAQTVTYTSNPISRLWETLFDTIAAKAKAFGSFFSPNRVVVVLPQTTTEKPTPVITIDLESHKPSQWQTVEVHKPGSSVIDIELNNKPHALPSIDVEINHKPLTLPSIELSASIGRDIVFRRMQPVG